MINKELKVQVLCVAMNQNDLSLVDRMNVASDIVIANQTNRTEYVEKVFDYGTVKMVSTNTRGVGYNRNTAFLYADGDILLLADDDVKYAETYISDVKEAFVMYPDADVFIFNIISTDEKRRQKQNTSTKRLNRFSRLPYGGPRIAVRRTAWERSNVWFTTLFGGGAKYTNGEDSLFLIELRKKGLNIYVSNKCIGEIDMEKSSWYNGANEEFYFNKGAWCSAAYSPFIVFLKMLYFAARVNTELSFKARLKWFFEGVKAYNKGMTYKEWLNRI